MMLGIGQPGKSWKTTIGGVVNIIFGAGMIVFAAIVPMPAAVAYMVGAAGVKDISTGLSLVFAKDNDVTGVPNAMNTDDTARTPMTKPSEPLIKV